MNKMGLINDRGYSHAERILRYGNETKILATSASLTSFQLHCQCNAEAMSHCTENLAIYT